MLVDFRDFIGKFPKKIFSKKIFFNKLFLQGDYEKSSNFAQVTINLIKKDLNASDKNQSILDKNLLRLKRSKSFLNNEDGSSKIFGIDKYDLQYKAINSVNLIFADFKQVDFI